MEFWRYLKGRVRGREGWRTINNFLFLIIYSVLFFGMFLFLQYLWIVFIVLGMVIPSYGFLFVNHLRGMEQRDKGNEVFGGWVEHRHGKGELKYFYPEEIVPYERLSEVDKEYVDDFMEYVAELTKEQIKVNLEAKETKEPPKLLSYEEREKKEQEELEALEEEFEEIYNGSEETTIKIGNQGVFNEMIEDQSTDAFFEINGKTYPDKFISKYKSLGKVPIRKGKFTKSFKEWCDREEIALKTEGQGECEDE